MFNGIFNKITHNAPQYDQAKIRPLLKMAITRLRIVQGKRRNELQKQRRELADLLRQGNVAGCRVRVESVMREESAIGGFEILAMLLDLVASRLPTITNAGNICPPEMKEAVTSIIWASPYVGTHVPEFNGIGTQITAKFGPTFIMIAEKNKELSVHEQLRASFDPNAPSEARCIKYMESICTEFNIPLDPSALHGDGVLGKAHKNGDSDGDDGDDEDNEGDTESGFSMQGYWIPYIVVPKDESEAKLLALKRAWS